MLKALSTIIITVLILFSCTGCESKSQKAQEVTTSQNSIDLYVFIAASLKDSMEEIKTLYAKENPNVNIILNADSAGILQTQIEEGAECDIFFSAATKQMNALEEEGLVERNTIRNLLNNQVVLIKPKDGKTEVTGFDSITKAKNIALAGEDVPVGTYAREIFKKMGVFDDVMKMEINEGSNVTAVLAAVSEKSNEVGIVYATDAQSVAESVEVIATAPKDALETPVIYPVGQIVNEDADEKEKKAAQEFLEYLSSDIALDVFKKNGFTIFQE